MSLHVLISTATFVAPAVSKLYETKILDLSKENHIQYIEEIFRSRRHYSSGYYKTCRGAWKVSAKQKLCF